MVQSNSTVNLIPLDFTTLKNSFIAYMKSQDRFKDYNFEAANINTMISLLAYNSFLSSFYGNMLGSEMFLDSAQLRDSIVSHAKELDYVPRSNISAVINVDLFVDTNNQAQTSLVIAPYTTFTGRVG